MRFANQHTQAEGPKEGPGGPLSETAGPVTKGRSPPTSQWLKGLRPCGGGGGGGEGGGGGAGGGGDGDSEKHISP